MDGGSHSEYMYCNKKHTLYCKQQTIGYQHHQCYLKLSHSDLKKKWLNKFHTFLNLLSDHILSLKTYPGSPSYNAPEFVKGEPQPYKPIWFQNIVA